MYDNNLIRLRVIYKPTRQSLEIQENEYFEWINDDMETITLQKKDNTTNGKWKKLNEEEYQIKKNKEDIGENGNPMIKIKLNKLNKQKKDLYNKKENEKNKEIYKKEKCANNNDHISINKMDFHLLLQKANDLTKTIENIKNKMELFQNENTLNIERIKTTIEEQKIYHPFECEIKSEYIKKEGDIPNQKNTEKGKFLLSKWKKISRSETSSASECESDIGILENDQKTTKYKKWKQMANHNNNNNNYMSSSSSESD